jgi:hypothetical protein
MEAITKLLVIFGAIALLVLLCALPVMWLWNWLMPELFRLKEITFLQALGLAALCSLLFKANVKTEK